MGFIARLRPGRFPDSDARKLPSSTNNLLGWVLPPLVIYAVEAHTITPFIKLLHHYFRDARPKAPMPSWHLGTVAWQAAPATVRYNPAVPQSVYALETGTVAEPPRRLGVSVAVSRLALFTRSFLPERG